MATEQAITTARSAMDKYSRRSVVMAVNSPIDTVTSHACVLERVNRLGRVLALCVPRTGSSFGCEADGIVCLDRL